MDRAGGTAGVLGSDWESRDEFSERFLLAQTAGVMSGIT